MPVLEVHSLECRRGGRLVLRDISFALHPGACLLVMGPNGSGKSSLLRMLAGLTPAASGTIRWNSEQGGDLAACLTYIGHQDAVKPELTVAEMVGYWCALNNENPVFSLNEVLASFDLTHLKLRPIRTLSAGQKRRLSLTRLLLADAPLWLLDEPATALDRQGQQILTEAIAAHRAKGGLVIAALHDELEIEEPQILYLPAGKA